MEMILTVLYFIGLVMLGIATGEYHSTPELAFMIIGSGTVLYAGILAVVIYLNPRK